MQLGVRKKEDINDDAEAGTGRDISMRGGAEEMVRMSEREIFITHLLDTVRLVRVAMILAQRRSGTMNPI